MLERGALNDLWNLAFAVILAEAWNLLGRLRGTGLLRVFVLSRDRRLFDRSPLAPGRRSVPDAARRRPSRRCLFGRHRTPRLPTARPVLRDRHDRSRRGGPRLRRRASRSRAVRAASGCRRARSTFRSTTSRWWASRSSRSRSPPRSCKSAFGRALAAIRQDIDAAESLGVNSTRHKLAAHALSAAIVALAGGLYAINFQYIAPGSVFDFRLSLSIVLMPVVGGVGTVVGPVLGALVFSTLQIKLLSLPALRDSYLFLYGGLLILVMLYEPKGLVGLWRRVARRRPPAVSPEGGFPMPAEPLPLRPRPLETLRGLLALSDVGFDVFEGEIFGVIGPNGAGKTTLFSCVVGSLAPTRGEVRFRGKRIDGLPNHAAVARGLVRTHQIVRPFRDMTVEANVSIGAHFGAGRGAAPRPRGASGRSWNGRARSPARALAGTLTIGELKRLEIARALATEPRAICLDEVMGGLNPAGDRLGHVAHPVRSATRGVTVLMIEHHVHAVAGVCDRILVLDFGERIAEGRPGTCCRSRRRGGLPGRRHRSALPGGLMLEVTGIDVFYGEVQALWDISFRVDAGEIVTLIGANGAGKTTAPEDHRRAPRTAPGRDPLRGSSLGGLPAHELVSRGLVLIPEARQLWPAMTVRENLEMGAYAKAARSRSRETLESVFDMFPVLEGTRVAEGGDPLGRRAADVRHRPGPHGAAASPPPRRTRARARASPREGGLPASPVDPRAGRHAGPRRAERPPCPRARRPGLRPRLGTRHAFGVRGRPSSGTTGSGTATSESAPPEARLASIRRHARRPRRRAAPRLARRAARADGPRVRGADHSFRDLDRLSARFAAGLAAFRVRRGDAVAVRMPTCPEAVVALLGILRAAAVHVPLNPAFGEEEAGHVLDDSGAKLTVAPSAAGDAPSGSEIAVRGRPRGGRRPGASPRTAATTTRPPSSSTRAGRRERARGWSCPFRAAVSNLGGVHSLWRIGPGTGSPSPSPSSTSTAWASASSDRSSTGRPSCSIRKFEPPAIVEAFRTRGATVFMGVPTMYVRLLEHLRAAPDAAPVLSKGRLFTVRERAPPGGGLRGVPRGDGARRSRALRHDGDALHPLEPLRRRAPPRERRPAGARLRGADRRRRGTRRRRPARPASSSSGATA